MSGRLKMYRPNLSKGTEILLKQICLIEIEIQKSIIYLVIDISYGKFD